MKLTLDQALQKGVEAHRAGKAQEADQYYTAILKANPKHPDANHNMGVLAVGIGKVEAALPFFKTALEANPGIGQFWLSYIDTLIKLGRLADAKNVFDQAKSKGARGDGFDQIEQRIGSPQNPNVVYNLNAQDTSREQQQTLITLYGQGHYREVLNRASRLQDQFPNSVFLYNVVGAANKGLGKLEEAIEAYQKALSIEPDYAEAYNNMGIALKDQGKLKEAIKAYTKALSLKPDYAEAYNNMGIALKDQGKLEEAVKAYQKALSIEPDFAKAYNNMGIALKDQGKLDEAIEAYNRALSIEPDYAETWNNLYFSLQAIKFQKKSHQNLNLIYPQDINSIYGAIQLSILDYKLHRGQESEEIYLDTALSLLSNADNAVIKNPKSDICPEDQIHSLPEKMVALMHWGRSGTGLLHSLIDGHPEVSTLPSIYLSEYFDHSIWTKIISSGWDGMVDHFMSTYDVLFDATSSVLVESKSKNLIYKIGIKEGMANVGDQKNEVLRVNKGVFREALKSLMACYEDLDAAIFFRLVHAAYDKAIKDSSSKSLIFYHIHNPDIYAQLNFARLNPNANFLLMVREPIQNCESWVKRPFLEDNYFRVTNRILTMLLEIDNPIYSRRSSMGFRLEDLKTKPHKTIPALCKWMGIKEEDSLYEMTAQGKKWWGDPSSPDYSKDGMEPFGTTSIKRKVGSLFSNNDQFILRTLFYPFSVRFGYTEENETQFESDLVTIRPMLDNLFDFERAIAEQMHMSCKKLVGSGSYLYLRSGLIERWNILNKYQTYPNMIRPLKIN